MTICRVCGEPHPALQPCATHPLAIQEFPPIFGLTIYGLIALNVQEEFEIAELERIYSLDAR